MRNAGICFALASWPGFISNAQERGPRSTRTRKSLKHAKRPDFLTCQSRHLCLHADCFLSNGLNCPGWATTRTRECESGLARDALGREHAMRFRDKHSTCPPLFGSRLQPVHRSVANSVLLVLLCASKKHAAQEKRREAVQRR